MLVDLSLIKYLQEIVMPEILYKNVVGVRCRVIPALPGKCELNKSWRQVKGSTGEDLFVTQELDEIKLMNDLRELRNLKINSIAVVLAHSYTLVDAFASTETFWNFSEIYLDCIMYNQI
jgi:N-methylhydantoinase A/oxoprolinase/acetone carboxylase beta subunit